MTGSFHLPKSSDFIFSLFYSDYKHHDKVAKNSKNPDVEKLCSLHTRVVDRENTFFSDDIL